MDKILTNKGFGLLNIRRAVTSGGQKVVVTHRNPANGKLWCESNDPKSWYYEGSWVDSSLVKFV